MVENLKAFFKKDNQSSPTTERSCKECGGEKKLQYCSFCKKETNSLIRLTVSDSIKVRESIGLIQKRVGFKKFVRKVFQGFQVSGEPEKFPEGVERYSNIDRGSDWYDETVKDIKTGKITRDIHEPLSQHISSAQKRGKVLKKS